MEAVSALINQAECSADYKHSVVFHQGTKMLGTTRKAKHHHLCFFCLCVYEREEKYSMSTRLYSIYYLCRYYYVGLPPSLHLFRAKSSTSSQSFRLSLNKQSHRGSAIS